MEEQSKPSRSLSFFKWVLLVFGILTTLSLLVSILENLQPRSGYSYPQFLMVLSAVASVLFFTSFFSVQYRKRYGRWLAALAFGLSAFNVVVASLWYFVIYDGPTNIVGHVLVVTFNIPQFVFSGWGALTFAFPPKVIAANPQTELLFPPPPPSFDDEKSPGN